jgi:hypothetical protein
LAKVLRVQVPVKRGVEVLLDVDDMETEFWTDATRGSDSATQDLEGLSVHVTEPIAEDSGHTYSVVVTSQRTRGGNVYAVNDLVNALVPGLSNPWRGNVLVFHHAKGTQQRIVNVLEGGIAACEQIVHQ